jgi:hypothetical protein
MATSTKRKQRLDDTYAFPGFRPLPTVRGIFGDPKARVVNPAAETLPLPEFEPMVRRLVAVPRNTVCQSALDTMRSKG